jgi:hypothetical protein
MLDGAHLRNLAETLRMFRTAHTSSEVHYATIPQALVEQGHTEQLSLTPANNLLERGRHSMNVCSAIRLPNYVQGSHQGGRVAMLSPFLAGQRKVQLLRTHLVIRVDRILEIARCKTRESRFFRHLARNRLGES